jgi:hypothetical protein
MNLRRKPGDIVFKPANYGFSGNAGRGIIPEGSIPDYCVMDCGDPACQECRIVGY